MDITRNWRLKTSRSQLLATRCPETGAVMLPQQTVARSRNGVYTFKQTNEQTAEVEVDYTRAAR
jgi:uncharacterized OB-fold protein